MERGRRCSGAGAALFRLRRIVESRSPLPTGPVMLADSGMDTSHTTSRSATAWNSAPMSESTRCDERCRIRSRSWAPSTEPTRWPTPTSSTSTAVTSRKRSPMLSVTRMSAGAMPSPKMSPATTPTNDRNDDTAPYL